MLHFEECLGEIAHALAGWVHAVDGASATLLEQRPKDYRIRVPIHQVQG